jgi:hypothetical protein
MQYAYRLSSAQNVWQDSRLAAGGISAPSLWYLKNFLYGLQSQISFDILLSIFGYKY